MKKIARLPVALPVTAPDFKTALNLIGQGLLSLSHAMGPPRALPVASLSLSPPAPTLTVLECVNEFLRAKARAGRSDRYLRQLRVSLKSFTYGRAWLSLDEIGAPQIEKWLANQDWAGRTQAGYLGDVRTLLNYAVRRGYLARNPAAGVETPEHERGGAVVVHSAAQVRAVLQAARQANLDICRHLAVRYFAGIRSAEAHRLRESDLKLDQGLIEVPALKAKTRARRLVTVQPNLAAWLALGGELRALSPDTVRGIVRASGVPWPRNVTRKSFVSYHLAHFQAAGKTALESGHSEAVLFANYRAVATPAQAAEFWAIVP